MTTYFLMVPDQWSPPSVVPSKSQTNLCDENMQVGRISYIKPASVERASMISSSLQKKKILGNCQGNEDLHHILHT
ncbi:hypothetical protein HAX54_025550 [Datura stramonium]|uniref:Uncharacterized protein n=1 Tax=Datura stramonium TaxID=4076 RepID=A0ABS8S6H2_DATST|nr:hypothetical protein [Datura stramonium]